jgi:CheY-like chemotaxis protein
VSVLLVTGDLMTSSRVGAAAVRCKISCLTALPAGSVEQAGQQGARLIVLDLAAQGLDLGVLVGQLKALPHHPKVIAFGPHVHEERLRLAAEAGCDEVISRGQFYARLDAILAPYANG